MNTYYQSCDGEEGASNSHNYPYGVYDNINQWKYCVPACCLGCYSDYLRTPNTAKQRHCNYCNCENCQNLHGYRYAQPSCESDSFENKLENFAFRRPEDQSGKQTHYFCGQYNVALDGNQSSNMADRQCAQWHDDHYGTPCRFQRQEDNNGFMNRSFQNNTACLPEMRRNETVHQLCYNRGSFQQNSGPQLNHVTNTSADNSFHSCRPCDSTKIQMVYKNNNGVCSKSTINQSSMQTIASKPSKPIFKKKMGAKKQLKSKINSGYFEFISPTPGRHVCKSPIASKTDTAAELLPNNIRKNPVRYGYFEVTEKNYKGRNNETVNQIALLELDKVPTKISKEIDTTHFKESIMLDKSLSANINHITFVKTSDKSLTVNLGAKEQRITHAEMFEILKNVSKYQPPVVKRSNKMIQFNLDGSFTKMQSNNSVHNICSNLNYTKDISEGSVSTAGKNSTKLSTEGSVSATGKNSTKLSTEGSVSATSKNSTKLSIQKSKESVTTVLQNRDIIKSYLDVALDDVETRILHKMKETVLIPKEVLNKKTFAANHNDKKKSALPYKATSQNSKTKKVVRNSPSPAQSLEDIDSEEVELDSEDLDDRSSISSDSNSKSRRKKKLSSYDINTNLTYFSHNSETINHNNKHKSHRQKSHSGKHDLTKANKQSNGCTQDCEEDQNVTEINEEDNQETARKASHSSKISKLFHKHPKGSNKNVSSCATHEPTEGHQVPHHLTRERNIRFHNDHLDTIDEERELQWPDTEMRLVHRNNRENSLMSLSEVCEPELQECISTHSDTSLNILCPSITGHSMHVIRSKMLARNRTSRERQPSSFSSSSSENQHHTCNHPTPKANKIARNDYYKCRRCCDCDAKEKYYSQFAPNNASNTNRCKLQSGRQHHEDLRDYYMNAPPYHDRNCYSNCPAGNMQVINFISFVVFTVMFFGIFHYISVVVL